MRGISSHLAIDMFVFGNKRGKTIVANGFQVLTLLQKNH